MKACTHRAVVVSSLSLPHQVALNDIWRDGLAFIGADLLGPVLVRKAIPHHLARTAVKAFATKPPIHCSGCAHSDPPVHSSLNACFLSR